jgi:hypothetical protein
MDAESESGAIYAFEKSGGWVEKPCDTPKGCIYAARFVRWYATSTSVECFGKHDSNNATLWVSQGALT